jgi:cellulose synthase/poly-beta-1,6-N-acetylglucosamine synthase-like glycosyltransferase
LWSDHLAGTATTTIQDHDPETSAERLFTRPQIAVALATAAVAITALLIWTSHVLVAVMTVLVVGYALVGIFRTLVTLRGSRVGSGERVSAAELRDLDDLPVYSILCPIYQEANMVSELLGHLERLDYPRAKLDVKLLVEEDDAETRERLVQLRVPSFCEVVVIPNVGPRTKPKACNYGLQLARGEYVVIFDAEDRPEPDQLKKSLVVFRRHLRLGSESLACVQAQLGFFNARQNWLTGCFALEYISFFRFFLPGLVSLGLPVPLGGTSNHLPLNVLRAVGAWDAFNVTEDADLGVRLHRAGYRTVIVDSVTWEEANSDFVNWTKQRSRWGKGYFVTWAVNMRHPVSLWKELGWLGWCSVQLTLAASYFSAVLNLLLWGLMAVWILGQPSAVASLFPPAIYYLALLELVLGNFLFIYMTLWCATESKAYGLTGLALTYPVYWLMISVAMVKAALQLLTDHVYWEKTTHGLIEPPAALGPAGSIAVVGRSAEARRSVAEAAPFAELSPRLRPPARKGRRR